jgi:hypothetical protein
MTSLKNVPSFQNIDNYEDCHKTTLEKVSLLKTIYFALSQSCLACLCVEKMAIYKFFSYFYYNYDSFPHDYNGLYLKIRGACQRQILHFCPFKFLRTNFAILEF